MTAKYFNELRDQKDYHTLGELFFQAFTILKKGSSVRKRISGLWHSLTPEEQKLCESLNL